MALHNAFEFGDMWSVRLKGLKELRQYLVNEEWKSEKDLLTIELLKDKEKEFLVSRIPYVWAEELKDYHLSFSGNIIKGSPFMLALAIGEYDAAEKILEEMDVLSIEKLGGLEFDTLGFGTNNKCRYTIESLLYEDAFVIPEKLRTTLLKRMEEEAEDLYDFSLRKIKTPDTQNIQKIFMSDVRKYPKLFERKSCLFAKNTEALLFLLKVFKDDESAKRLLVENEIGENFGSLGECTENTQGMMNGIGRIVKLLEKRTKTHKELYSFLLKIITYSRGMSGHIVLSEGKKQDYPELEAKLWKVIEALTFEQELFEELLMEMDTQTKFHLEILYELASKKLGKQLPLYVNVEESEHIGKFLGLNSTLSETFWNPFGSNACEGADTQLRILRLLSCVSSIEYPDSSRCCYNRKSVIANIITKNADRIKDVFADLLLKGLIPMEDLDYMMKRVNNNKQCIYMRPLLILQKFGGLISDKG